MPPCRLLQWTTRSLLFAILGTTRIFSVVPQWIFLRVCPPVITVRRHSKYAVALVKWEWPKECLVICRSLYFTTVTDTLYVTVVLWDLRTSVPPNNRPGKIGGALCLRCWMRHAQGDDNDKEEEEGHNQKEAIEPVCKKATRSRRTS